MLSSPSSHLLCILLFSVHRLPVAKRNWLATAETSFLMSVWMWIQQERGFWVPSTARIVAVSLQGHWMERGVNECGESKGPLWLCVSLIRGWWEAVWGRDGAYYSYGTLRAPREALLGCLLCGQQYSRYKHSKQHMKENHYPNEKTQQILHGDH